MSCAFGPAVQSCRMKIEFAEEGDPTPRFLCYASNSEGLAQCGLLLSHPKSYSVLIYSFLSSTVVRFRVNIQK